MTGRQPPHPFHRTTEDQTSVAHDDTKYKRVTGAIDRDYRPATFDSNNSSPTRGNARKGPYVKQVAPRYGGNEMTPARCERPGSGRTERTRTT